MKLLVSMVALGVIGIGGWMLFQHYSDEKIVEQHLSLITAELAYTTQLAEGLRRLDSSSTKDRGLTVILSPKVINGVLNGLVGASVALPHSRASITVKSVSVSFRDGFPEVQLASRIEASGRTLSLDSVVIATLEPQLPSGSSSTMQLLVRPLDVHPVVAVGSTEIKLTRDIDSFLAAVLAEYALTVPRFYKTGF